MSTNYLEKRNLKTQRSNPLRFGGISEGNTAMNKSRDNLNDMMVRA